MFGNPEFFPIIKTENKRKYLKNIYKIRSNQMKNAKGNICNCFLSLLSSVAADLQKDPIKLT